MHTASHGCMFGAARAWMVESSSASASRRPSGLMRAHSTSSAIFSVRMCRTPSLQGFGTQGSGFGDIRVLMVVRLTLVLCH